MRVRQERRAIDRALTYAATWVTAQPDGRPATNPGRSPTAIAFGQRHERASAQKLSATSDVVQATASSTRSQTSPYHDRNPYCPPSRNEDTLNAVGLSPSIDTPAHVPESLVYDFDFNADPAYVENPHARVLDLIKKRRASSGRHATVAAGSCCRIRRSSTAFRNWEVFSSEHFTPEEYEEMMAALPPEQRVPAPIPICVDPPLQSKLRAPLVLDLHAEGRQATRSADS